MRAILQSVSARFGAWRGRRRREGDGGRRLGCVIHWQDEARAADGHVVFRQLVIQTFVELSFPGCGGALGVDGAGSGRIRADGDVGVQGAHVGIVGDDVGVVVMELPFILVSGEGKGKEKSREEL